MKISLLLCLEWYRTPEQGHDSDDFMVDGIKLFTIPILVQEQEAPIVEEALNTFMKPMVVEFCQGVKQRPESFPKAAAQIATGVPFWFHAPTREFLEALPTEFHGNGFSEAELLGLSPEDNPGSRLSLYLSRDGEPLSGPPDKFMLSMGAV